MDETGGHYSKCDKPIEKQDIAWYHLQVASKQQKMSNQQNGFGKDWGVEKIEGFW